MEQIFVMEVAVSIACQQWVRLWARGFTGRFYMLVFCSGIISQMTIGLLAAIKSLLDSRATKPIAGNRQFTVIAKAGCIAWHGCYDLGVKPTMRGGSTDDAKRFTVEILPDLTQAFDHYLRVILQMLMAPLASCLNGEGWRAKA